MMMMDLTVNHKHTDQYHSPGSYCVMNSDMTRYLLPCNGNVILAIDTFLQRMTALRPVAFNSKP